MNDNNDNGRVRPPMIDLDLSNIAVNGKRGKYIVVSPANKLLIAKQAVRNGILAAIAAHSRLDLKYATLAH